jgi:hypothetical protein
MTNNLEEDPQAVVSAIDLDLPRGKAPKPRKPKRIQVLALSGGGYRGLYGATFFEHVEKHFGCKVSSKFDLIAGTSIQNFFRSTSCNIVLSRLRSATSCFNRLFSSWSCFICRA